MMGALVPLILTLLELGGIALKPETQALVARAFDASVVIGTKVVDFIVHKGGDITDQQIAALIVALDAEEEDWGFVDQWKAEVDALKESGSG